LVQSGIIRRGWLFYFIENLLKHIFKMKNIIFFISGWIVVLFFIYACDSDKDRRPNIIIFFSDELAPEYLGAYGGKIPTPHLDNFASGGIRFDRAYVAASMCTPSRFALLTGKYPGRCAHPEFKKSYPEDQPYVIAWNTFLDGNLPTIPSLLSGSGYFTGMAGKWHIGKLPEGKPIPQFSQLEKMDDPEVQRKLQEYQETVISEVKRISGFDYASSVLWGNFDGFIFEPLRYHNFPWITHGAIRFLELAKKQDKPFFLYVATTAVHGPGHADTFNKDLRYTLEGRIDEIQKYALPSDSMKRQLEALPGPLRHRYAGMACLDNHFYHVMKKLNELALDNNTVVLFMADHNVEPGKATCYEKGIHVPFIMDWPGHFENLRTSENLISSVDLLPTLLEIAGVSLPDETVFDGISILPGLENTDIPIRSHIYAESGLARTVNDGRWKYIAFRYPQYRIEEMETGQINFAPNQLNLERQAHSSIAMDHYPYYFAADQLYDLDNDPYEQNNLAYDSSYKDTLFRMQDLLGDHLLTFKNDYPLGDTSFIKSVLYNQLVEKSLSIGTEYIPWLSRDHGNIIWPPKE
jgi:arylsulfatase A-like enzyme